MPYRSECISLVKEELLLYIKQVSDLGKKRRGLATRAINARQAVQSVTEKPVTDPYLKWIAPVKSICRSDI
jgi:hypothetical protein